MDSRYHLSTLEIMSWAKKQKIFFKHLKALWLEICRPRLLQLHMFPLVLPIASHPILHAKLQFITPKHTVPVI